MEFLIYKELSNLSVGVICRMEKAPDECFIWHCFQCPVACAAILPPKSHH